MKSRLIPLLALLPLTVSAEIQFNGFASIKGSMTFDDAKDIDGNGRIDSSEAPNFGAYDDNFSLKHDSLVALQATSDLGEGLSATVQLFAEGREDWDVEARWAYLSYEITDETSVSAGRLALPIFYKSEFQDVGYAHNYATLPTSVYSPQDYEVIEGIRLSHNTFIGDWNVNASLMYGSWQGDITVGGVETSNNRLDNLISVNLLLNKDWFTLFGGYISTDLDFDGLNRQILEPQIDAAVAAPLQGELINANEVAELKKRLLWQHGGEYYYYGFEVDYQNWLFTTEYAEYSAEDSSDTANETWYISAGKRFDKVTVLYTRESYDQKPEYSVLNGLGPVSQQVGRGLINFLASQKFTQDKVSVRYDFHDSAAFKFEVFSYDPVRSNEEIIGMTLGVDLLF